MDKIVGGQETWVVLLGVKLSMHLLAAPIYTRPVWLLVCTTGGREEAEEAFPSLI